MCGAEFVTSHGRRVYCSPECSKEGQKQISLDYYWKDRVKPDDMYAERKCKGCGVRFKPTTVRNSFCTKPCRLKYERALIRANKSGIKAKPKSQHEAAVEINAKARELGMSYGQYVALMEMERTKHRYGEVNANG